MSEPTIPDWIQAGAAVLAVIGAIVVGWRQIGLSRNQTEIQEFKLRESLFERRMDVFNDVEAFIHNILAHARPADPEHQHEFLRARMRARFLFSEEVTSRLDEMWKMQCNYQLHHGYMTGEYGGEKSRSQDEIKASNECLEWFLSTSESLVGIFAEIRPLAVKKK